MFVGVKEDLRQLLQEIKDSELRWRLKFHAVHWTAKYEFEQNYFGKPEWSQPLGFPLTASDRIIVATPEKCYEVLKSMDNEITKSQLDILFGKLETMCRVIRDNEFPLKKSEPLYPKEIDDILHCRGKYAHINKGQPFISTTDEGDYTIAKQTRNAPHHSDDKIDRKWEDSNKESGYFAHLSIKKGDVVPGGVPDVERWQDMIIRIAENMVKHADATF